MLSEAYNVRKIVIATGYTDLRKGIEGLSELVLSNYHLNPRKRMSSFFSAAGGATASKGSSGKATAFFSSISALKPGASPGQGAGRKRQNSRENSTIS